MYLSRADFIARTIMAPDDVASLSRLVFARNADGDAAAASAEALVGSTPLVTSVAAILLTLDDAIEADDTDYATITVYKRTAAGVRTTIATATTKTTGGGGLGDLGAGVAYGLTVAAASLGAGDQVTIAIAKAGAGVIVPAATLRVEYDPSYVDARLAIRASQIDARLKKRYAVPFGAPVPEIVLGWQEALVTYDCFLRRGFTPGSAQDAEIVERAKAADAQIKEAADSKDGLFDLPLLESDPSKSGVSAGGPLGYSETSPYVAFDVEGRNGRADDARGCGS